MKTTEEIITMITEKLINAESRARYYFKFYEEAEKNNPDMVKTYESLFFEFNHKADLLHDLLKEIFKNEQ